MATRPGVSTQQQASPVRIHDADSEMMSAPGAPMTLEACDAVPDSNAKSYVPTTAADGSAICYRWKSTYIWMVNHDAAKETGCPFYADPSYNHPTGDVVPYQKPFHGLEVTHGWLAVHGYLDSLSEKLFRQEAGLDKPEVTILEEAQAAARLGAAIASEALDAVETAVDTVVRPTAIGAAATAGALATASSRAASAVGSVVRAASLGCRHRAPSCEPGGKTLGTPQP